MRIYDCFTFFNELDLLEIRLTELDSVVDVFVLVESDLTFQGGQKPLYFAQNRDRFARWLPKIRHVVVDDNPETEDPWVRERHQRESLRRGFTDARPDDFVLISDLDEIPSRDGLSRAINEGGLRFIETRLFYHSLNLMTATGRTWTATFIAPRSEIDAIPSFTEQRFVRCSDGGRTRERVIPNAGWHFSSVGGVQAIQTKLSAFSETSPDVLAMNDRNFLSKHLKERTVFFSGEPLISVSPMCDFPEAIMHNPQHYHDLGLITDDYFSAPPIEKVLARKE